LVVVFVVFIDSLLAMSDKLLQFVVGVDSPASRDKLKFVGLEDGQLTLAATHVLMSTAAWQLPANAGEQVLPVETGPQRFLPYMLISGFCRFRPQCNLRLFLIGFALIPTDADPQPRVGKGCEP